MATVCACGCGQDVPPRNKSYVDNEHRIEHMLAGEAKRMNALLPDEVRRAGGHTSGKAAAESGRLAEAGLKGAESARRTAERLRARRAEL